MPAAAHHDLPVRVHDVAIAVADAVELSDGRVLPQYHVVSPHDVDAVLHGAGHVVGPDVHEVADQPFLADVVEVWREEDPRPLEGEDAAGLDEAAVGADDHAELDPAALEDGEVAALLVEG